MRKKIKEWVQANFGKSTEEILTDETILVSELSSQQPPMTLALKKMTSQTITNGIKQLML